MVQKNSITGCYSNTPFTNAETTVKGDLLGQQRKESGLAVEFASRYVELCEGKDDDYNLRLHLFFLYCVIKLGYMFLIGSPLLNLIPLP